MPSSSIVERPVASAKMLSSFVTSPAKAPNTVADLFRISSAALARFMSAPAPLAS